MLIQMQLSENQTADLKPASGHFSSCQHINQSDYRY